MSLIQTSEPVDGAAWLRLRKQLMAAGHRRLVLIEGDRQAAVAWLRALFDRWPEGDALAGVWSGPADESPCSELCAIRPVEGRQWLGGELDLVVWDGWHGNPPDSLAALAGTLKAGGLLFWLMPPLAQWAGFDDPDYRRTGLDGADDHPFAARMSELLASSPDVIRVDPQQGGVVDLPAVPVPQTPFEIMESGDQRRLVDNLVQTGQGRRRRPLVITADRGRGKSAALGMAAIKLLEQGRRQVMVTAPTEESVATLFRHARLAAGDSGYTDTPEGDVVLANGGRLSYLTPDQLLDGKPDAELVMVDEAAAIPANRLARILLGWPRVVFASTVHGYEGAGRGFAIRFRKVLDTQTPQWRKTTLKTPIRWSGSDPLEPLIARLFLLDADAPAEVPESGEVSIERWSPAHASEQDLAEAFGLLINAHYRTTPADLRQWVDDPDAISWRLTINGQLAGVLWAAREGGLSPELAGQVMRGSRRLRGHLLPQSLANHSGFAEAASRSWLRVVRIAVSEQCRFRGLGKQLVARAAEYAEAAGYDGLGTSFGGSEALIRFWQRAGLTLVRAGMKREASSGEYPVQMLVGTSDGARALVSKLNDRLSEHWPTLVPLNWRDMEPGVLRLMTAELATSVALSEDDVRDLHSFADGYRGFELTVPVLRKVSLTQGFSSILAVSDDADLWCRRVTQGWSWPELQHAGLCRGQKDGETRLRQLTGKLLQQSRNL
ncbi:tRNA(Met) cytidine acetyltransferase TmcA [Marinobacter sp. DUT-3]|uniref:tRNA(Met) cytidine acetyltransferase TmcA n=1 Tax=Marinobacter sp. DUT-3 TaxID=3412036 RepID=UPI003D172D70